MGHFVLGGINLETQTFLGWAGKIRWSNSGNIPECFKKAQEILRDTSSPDEVAKYFRQIFRVVFNPDLILVDGERIQLPNEEVVGSSLMVRLHSFSELSVPTLSIGAKFTFPVTKPFQSQDELDAYQEQTDYLYNALSFELDPDATEVTDQDAEYMTMIAWDEMGFELAEQP